MKNRRVYSQIHEGIKEASSFSWMGQGIRKPDSRVAWRPGAAIVIALCFFWTSVWLTALECLLMKPPWGALASVAKILSIGFSGQELLAVFQIYFTNVYTSTSHQISLSSKFQDDFSLSLSTAQRRHNCSYTQSQLTVKLCSFIRW